MDIRKHYLLFGLFAVIYVIATGLLTTTDDKKISMTLGVLLIISGIWGLCVGEILLKLPPSMQKYSKYVNLLLIFLGIISIMYGLLLL